MKQETNNALMGSRIRAAREEAGLSQADLAKSLGYESATAVSLIESGERRVKAEDLNIVSKVTDHSIAYLMGHEEDTPLDVKIALRADKNLTNKDKETILHFINLAKRRHGK